MPTKYVRNLIEQDYFEAIVFSGFEGKDLSENEKEENAFETEAPAPTIGTKDEEGNIVYAFNLTMRIKGGNNVELK